jgi:hypothetical protein
MRNVYLALAALLIGGSVAAAQTPTSPRLDGEGINMDRSPPLTPEPSHPADPLAPNTSNPAALGTTTGQAPRADRLPADRGDTRPVPNAPK